MNVPPQSRSAPLPAPIPLPHKWGISAVAGALPRHNRRVLPISLVFPSDGGPHRMSGRSACALPFSTPAQRSLLVTACMFAKSLKTAYSRGFDCFVTSTAAPFASDWNESCRVESRPLRERAFPRPIDKYGLSRLKRDGSCLLRGRHFRANVFFQIRTFLLTVRRARRPRTHAQVGIHELKDERALRRYCYRVRRSFIRRQLLCQSGQSNCR